MPSGDAPSLIPKPMGDDPEDVESALSTAEALWKRGEYHEAVRWVRKAANAAGDADADMRVIQLAKAAAELASMVDAFAPAKPVEKERAPEMMPPPITPEGETSQTEEEPPPRLSADRIELDIDVTTSIEPSPPAPEKPVPKEEPKPKPQSADASGRHDVTGRRPPGPPPRPLRPIGPETSVVTSAPALDALKAGASSPPSSRATGTTAFAPLGRDLPNEPKIVEAQHQHPAPAPTSPGPTPNPMPSPLQVGALEVQVPDFGEPIEEADVAPSSVRTVDSRRPPAVAPKPQLPHMSEEDTEQTIADRRVEDDDSMPRVPTVPPEPPDHHPTPMRMMVAPVAIIDPPPPPPAPPAPTVATTPSQPAPRLATPVSVGRAVDVRAERRDALGLAPAVDVRRPALGPEANKFVAAPAVPPAQAAATAPKTATSTSQRLRTIVSSKPPPPPAAPVLPAPRQKPASIPPPGKPLTVRPPSPPDRPLELDLGRSSLVGAVAEHADAAAAAASAIGTMDTHERLAAVPPNVGDTQQGLGPHPRDDGPRAPAAQPPLPPTAIAAKTLGLDLSRFEALGDVPEDERDKIVARGEVVSLLPEEEIDAPAIVLVLHGELEVRAKGRASPLEIVAADQLRILHPVPPAEAKLVVVGGRKGARLLSLPPSAVEELRAAAPWVVQDLEPLSDDLHVVAGAIRGHIGKRLDDALLGAILSRADTMRLPPNATVVKNGELVRALVIVGAGSLSLRSSDEPDGEETSVIQPGDVLFPSELLQRTKAPSTVRAGANGAVVLVATRAATEELMMTYPPLLDILSQS